MRKILFVIIGIFIFTVCSIFSNQSSILGKNFIFDNVMICFDKTSHGWAEQFWARDTSGKWKTILLPPNDNSLLLKENPELKKLYGGLLLGQPSLYKAPPFLPFSDLTVSNKNTFILKGRIDNINLTKIITYNKPIFHVKLSADTTDTLKRFEYFLASYSFAPDRKPISSYNILDFAFAPAIRPLPNNVISEHFFRAPAVMAQKNGLFAALIPDLDSISRSHPAPLIIDLDTQNGVVDAPLMSYGYCDHKLQGHVYYVHESGSSKKLPPSLILEYDIYVEASAPNPSEGPDFQAPKGLHAVTTYLWNRYGEKWFRASILPQTMPFSEYAKDCYPAAFNEMVGDKKLGWWEDTIDGVKVGGIYSGWGYAEGNTCWQAWFNNLRSAYGLNFWAKRLKKSDWEEKSKMMLAMALSAPQKNGVFPSVWNNFRKEWQGCLIHPNEAYYDTVDMAWKCYWLLKWYQDIDKREDILNYCKNYADFLLMNQLPSGAYPNWFDKDIKALDILQEAAPSSMPGWFLAEFYSVTKVKKYLDSAIRAADFIMKEVVPYARYYDFEVFFSCSPKPCVDGGRNHVKLMDQHTQQPWQNTLCMQWSAELLKIVYELTGEEKYLKSGLQALDFMSLYQNVWSLPYRRVAYTFGGFGVQNSDGEYLDARQSQFGCTLCDYGILLGRKDLFERGIAAIRASMTLINHPRHIANGIYPEPNYSFGIEPENCGHLGFDHQCGRSGFDWGEGGGLAGIAYILNKYGDVYIDTKAKWAVGIDGVDAIYKDDEVSIINTLANLDYPYEKKFKVSPLVSSDKKTSLKINGKKYSPKRKIPPLRLESNKSAENIIVDPSWNFENGEMFGWQIIGNFAEVPTSSSRMDFIKSGNWFIGTCEDGFGGYDDTYKGRIYSPAFKTTKNKIKIKVGGGNGNDVRVELRKGSNHEVIYTERGNNNEKMDEKIWDVSNYKNASFYIVVIDESEDGWGHINIDDIYCE